MGGTTELLARAQSVGLFLRRAYEGLSVRLKVSEPLEPAQVSSSVWFVRSPISNAVVVEAPDSIVVFDCLARADWATAMFGAVSDAGNGRPIVVFNSHYHWDHTFGNVVAPVVPSSTSFTRDQLISLGSDYFVAATSVTQTEVPAGASDDSWLPEALSNQEGWSLALVDEPRISVEMIPTAAHTGGDLILVVDDDDASSIACGDLVFNGLFPAIDPSTSISGWVASLNTLMLKEGVFLPGHGPAADRAVLRRIADYFAHLREHVRSSKSQGLPLSDAVASFPIDEYGWGREERVPELYARLFDEAGTQSGGRIA